MSTTRPDASPPVSQGRDASVQRTGLLHAIAAYALWGGLPIYFVLLAPAGPVEVVAWRIIFSLGFCVLLIALLRTWRSLWEILRRPRLVLLMGLAGALIVINWTVYVYGTLAGFIVETSLGYFINPIVTVLLGVLILRESLRRAQWVAVALCAIAVIVLAVGYGAFPWISLVLAFSFGIYGFVKKWVGPRVDAVSGLTLETAWLTPLAALALVVVSMTTGLAFGTVSVAHTFLLVAAGVVTAVPLLFFAAASRRLPLVWLGLTQFLAPVLQFLFGAFVMHEPMPPERWIGFGIVWIALVVLTVDMIAHARSMRRASPLPA